MATHLKLMIDWNQIELLLLDMDGTLLTCISTTISGEHVPMRYAEAYGLSGRMLGRSYLPRYQRMEGTLQWYCIDHWSEELGLDIALPPKQRGGTVDIGAPHVVDFLRAMGEQGRRRVLVTNAHQIARFET